MYDPRVIVFVACVFIVWTVQNSQCSSNLKSVCKALLFGIFLEFCKGICTQAFKNEFFVISYVYYIFVAKKFECFQGVKITIQIYLHGMHVWLGQSSSVHVRKLDIIPNV